jgi:hypothetical protein
MKEARIIRAFLLIVCLLVPVPAQAQLTIPRQLVEFFFLLVEQGRYTKAFDKLFEGSSIPKAQPQAVELIKKRTEWALYGRYWITKWWSCC